MNKKKDMLYSLQKIKYMVHKNYELMISCMPKQTRSMKNDEKINTMTDMVGSDALMDREWFDKLLHFTKFTEIWCLINLMDLHK